MRSPWQLIGFIILIASLASAFEVRYVGELPTYPITIFQLEYNKVEQELISFKPISQLFPSLVSSAIKGREDVISNTDSNITNQQRTTNLSQVNPSRKSIISESLIGMLKQIEKRIEYTTQNITQEVKKIIQSIIPHTKCTKNECFFQQRLTDITKLDNDVSFLLPGQLIQLKDSSDFSKGVQLYQSKEYTRNKLAVMIQLNGIRSLPLRIDPTENDISSKITNKLLDHLQFLNSRPIKLYVQISNRIGTVLKNLGLSTKIYEVLRLATGLRTYSKDEKSLQSEKKTYKVDKMDSKMVIILHQSLFSASIDLLDPESQKINVFFNVLFQTYSQMMLQEITERIKDGEFMPLVVTQANFGRLLIFTLQQNMENLGIKDKLEGCFVNERLQNYLAFSEIMSTISKQRPQYYHAGVARNQILRKKTIDWQDIFFPITATTISQLQPISARARSLTGHPYVQTQRRYYTQYECKNKIELLVTNLEESVIFQGLIEPIRPEDKHPFNLTHPGTFQISSLVGSEPFELNLVARSTAKLRRLTSNGASYGIRFFFMKKKPVYSIQAQFALLVNGEERLRHAIGNSRSDRQYRGVRIRIDPNHLVDMKILEDF